MNNLAFDFAARRWWVVDRDDPRARRLVDGQSFGTGPHYSRQTPRADEFMPSGRTLVLLTECERAVWGAIENLDPAGGLHWRCSIFRNEGAGLSSDLVSEATSLTFEWWRRHYGGLPAAPLRTEVNARKVRHKRDPGRCFRRAGWRVVSPAEVPRATKRGLVVLEAPSRDSQDRGGLIEQLAPELQPSASERPGGSGEDVGGNVEGFTHDVVSARPGGGCS